ncbi:MAG: hypothetical protein A2008_01650 [Candidatus Wallbacteria bacterium GWC2_49_35]|uniref:TadE-like domain-containing protein n=1 Tax=Candidatus Wallbacteria bacterium GWC2_49_35 TaxID=1817813 RepID=A0A1F7WT88_9BACT|nr:MAG: hypothetical protein A2008_01650 [Candidatus Wallbacteria bacterium GWC2_49_35]
MNNKIIPLKNRKGQSMVEFALVLPILLMFFVGIIQLGMIINDYIALNRAVSDACRFGSTLVGYSSAEIMIAGKLIDGLGENIKKDKLKIISLTNTKYGPYTKSSSGALLNSAGSEVTSFAEILFYRKDNGTPTVFTDDAVVSPTSYECAYVSVSVEYEHQVIIPFADLISSATVMLTASNTWPISTVYPDLLKDRSLFRLSGALPIAVNEKSCVLTGESVVIKGDWILPGGFGWLDLSVYFDSGNNPNAGPTDLAEWISGSPDNPTINITPPQQLYSMTGEKNASAVRDALAALLGQNIMVPIYDTIGSQGNNGFYHIIGFAVFKLDSVQDYPDLGATYVKTIYITHED